jgi:acyl-CoA thioesterase
MTKPSRTPQETAELAARVMWATDRAVQALQAELIEVGPKMARVSMKVREDMTNGHDTAHGGYIFALADTAFAYACNASGQITVAAHCSITFIRPGRLGDVMVAHAREVSRNGRSGIYDVQVAVNGVTIAEFRGHSRALGGSFIDDGASAD